MNRFLRWLAFASLTVPLLGVVTAVAAANTIPATRLDDRVYFVGINDLKPSLCAGIYVTNLVTGAGTITGTNGNDLILGSAGADIIDGSGGNDCILGGGGDDQITGGDGSDVCLGGPGIDLFTNCEQEIQ